MHGDFRIGGFTIVPTLNQILREGTAVHVEPKVMCVLLALVARGGEVARREELIREVWPDTFVTDDVLKRCISDLRKALGDDHRSPRFIETISKVGYRLLPAVEPADASEEARHLPSRIEPETVNDESESAAATSTGTTSLRARRRHWMTVAVAAVVFIGAATAATYWTLRPPDVPAPRISQLSAEPLVSFSSFSPDGSQIAYSSPGDHGNNSDIWLQIVGEAEARRLTTDEAADTWPAWAPDGKQIAFVRFPSPRASTGSVYLVSPLGGAERRLLDFGVRGTSLSWSPDGRWLAAAKASPPTTLFGTGIYLIPPQAASRAR